MPRTLHEATQALLAAQDEFDAALPLYQDSQITMRELGDIIARVRELEDEVAGLSNAEVKDEAEAALAEGDA